jgi:hypothetical protein
MRGTQFLAAATNDTEHPCHYMHNHRQTPRHIKNASEHYYNTILHSIPPPTSDTYTNKHIHTALADRALTRLGNNHVLGYAPPPIDESEMQLHRTDRVHLATLRCGHHAALKSYQHKLDENTDDTCPLCQVAPHTINHIFEECTALADHRQRHNIRGIEDLWSTQWEQSASSAALGSNTGLPGVIQQQLNES